MSTLGRQDRLVKEEQLHRIRLWIVKAVPPSVIIFYLVATQAEVGKVPLDRPLSQAWQPERHLELLRGTSLCHRLGSNLNWDVQMRPLPQA